MSPMMMIMILIMMTMVMILLMMVMMMMIAYDGDDGDEDIADANFDQASILARTRECGAGLASLRETHINILGNIR